MKSPERSHPLADIAGRIVGQSMFRILEKAKELERAGQELIHFEIGDTHLEMPAEVKAAAQAAMQAGRTHYSSSVGEFNLRTAIQKSVQEDFGFAPDLSQIVVSSGANPFIYYVLSLVANPGEEVILSDPSFVTYNAVLRMLDIKPVYVPLSHVTGFRLDPAEVAKRITAKTRLIILNSPSNPTGAVSTRADIEGVCAVAKQHGLFVLSDEIYSRLVYDGEHFSPGVLDQCRERVIVTNGFSKPFAMTGWRVGYAVGPSALIEKVGLLSQTIVSCVPPFLQDACLVALENRKEFAQRYSNEYRKLRAVVCEELAKSKAMAFAKPSGATYVMIDVSKTGMDGDEFAAFAMERGVVVCPGSGFGPGSKHYIRLSYANAEAKVREGCRRLCRAAQEAAASLPSA